MKKISVLIVTFIFSMIAIAKNPSSSNANLWKNKYCASMKDGKLTMMNEDKVMTADVTLENGTKVTADGYLVKKDGTRKAVKSGECISNDGTIVHQKKDKMKKSSSGVNN